MQNIGFGDPFCNMIKMLYVNSSNIKLNNGVSPIFVLKLGIGQGCSVSPSLFITATQFSSLFIKRRNLKGINIGTK